MTSIDAATRLRHIKTITEYLDVNPDLVRHTRIVQKLLDGSLDGEDLASTQYLDLQTELTDVPNARLANDLLNHVLQSGNNWGHPVNYSDSDMRQLAWDAIDELSEQARTQWPILKPGKLYT